MTRRIYWALLYILGSSAFLLAGLGFVITNAYLSGDVEGAAELAGTTGLLAGLIGLVLFAGGLYFYLTLLKNELWPSVRAYWRGEKA